MSEKYSSLYSVVQSQIKLGVRLSCMNVKNLTMMKKNQYFVTVPIALILVCRCHYSTPISFYRLNKTDMLLSNKIVYILNFYIWVCKYKPTSTMIYKSKQLKNFHTRMLIINSELCHIASDNKMKRPCDGSNWIVDCESGEKACNQCRSRERIIFGCNNMLYLVQPCNTYEWQSDRFINYLFILAHFFKSIFCMFVTTRINSNHFFFTPGHQKHFFLIQLKMLSIFVR